MADRKLISVIVPVYKVEKYLPDCIKHLLIQTYKNLEIILVDDGSPDNCPSICDEYAEKDSRIKVIHQKNAGLSAARNAGLKIAAGDYIGFVDSDDYPQENMFEELYRSIRISDSDLAVCGVKKFGNETKSEFYGEKCIGKSDFLKLLLSEEIKSYVWNKLYKKELFSNLCFPEGELFEDMRIMHLIAEKAESLSLTDKTYYNYRIRDNSITSESKGIKASAYYDATHSRSKKYHGTEFYEYAAAGEFKCLRVIVSDMTADKKREEYAELYNEAKRLYGVCRKNLSGYQKILSMLFFFSPRLYRIIKKLYLKS